MGLFNWGEEAKGIGEGVSTGLSGIRYALNGDLPPATREALAQAEIELARIESKVKEGQVELNKIDAQSGSFIKSGWRPSLGWIAVLGFALQFVLFPLYDWVLNIYIVFKKIDLTTEQMLSLAPPQIDAWLLLNLLGVLLGVGTMRTFEKYKGITK